MTFYTPGLGPALRHPRYCYGGLAQILDVAELRLRLLAAGALAHRRTSTEF